VSELLKLETHLKLAGLALLVLAFAHVFFEKRFGWKEDFKSVSPFNRQVFYVHNFFIMLLLALLGALSLFGTEAMLEKSALGRYVAGGTAFFWACRWVTQLFVYDSALWRGKKFETRAHICFSLFWTYLVAVYGWCFWWQVAGP
jgi:hypothetical protein